MPPRALAHNLLVASILGMAHSASAADAEEGRPQNSLPNRQPYALANDTPTFMAIETGAATALTLVLTLSTSNPARCDWCAPSGFDSSLREAMYMKDSKTPAVISHITSLGIAPLAAFAAVIVPALGSEHPSYAVADALEIVNTTLLISGIGDFTKKATARQRPGFYYGRESETEASASARNLSFFSLDTAWAFTFTATAATLAYERGYWTAPYVVGVGAAAGVATGALRMAADMHWFSDVAVGTVVGVGIGVSLPLLLHPRRGSPDRMSLAPVLTPTFAGFGASGAWL